MNVQPTVKDVSRAVANLSDSFAMGDPYKREDGIARVASNLAFQFARVNPWGGRKNITTRDVRAALISHGADAITIDKYARTIASRIRSDFTDGWNYHKGEN
jgi:hypothetical protein